MFRRGSILAGAVLALLFLTAPGWTFPGRHGPSMGMSNVGHSPGAFVHSAGGFRSFGTGALTPTTHNGFVPTTGFFNPISNGVNPFGTGAFTPSPRSVFVPSTGSFNSFSNGVNGFATRGAFNPGAAGIGRSNLFPVNPASFAHNLPNSVFDPTAYAHSVREYNRDVIRNAEGLNTYNPYWNGGSFNGYNPYGNGFSYGSPFGSYGGGSYGAGAGGYGGGVSYAAAPPTTAAPPAAVASNATTTQPKQPSALAAFGIPVEFGEVKWPLALRLMPPDTKRDLLDKLESQMKIAANQAISGNASQVLLREASSTIGGVKQWLHDRRSNMSESTYQDGDLFLRRLEDALRKMDA